MPFRATKILLLCLAFAVSAPSLADRDDDDDEWRGGREHLEYRRNHHHHHQKHHRHYVNTPCRVEGWYDRHGYYHERQSCRETRVRMPGPTLMLAPPSVIIQPPGIYIR